MTVIPSIKASSRVVKTIFISFSISLKMRKKKKMPKEKKKINGEERIKLKKVFLAFSFSVSGHKEKSLLWTTLYHVFYVLSSHSVVGHCKM